MSRKPVAIGLMACEQVIVEETTRNLTPVNCFTHRAMRTFPTEPISFAVAAFLTDGLGDIELEIALQSLDNMDQLYRVGRRFRFETPLEESSRRISLRVPGSQSLVSKGGSISDCATGRQGACRPAHDHPQTKGAVMKAEFDPEGFDSRDSTVVIVDEPGDRTVRPCQPNLRAALEALRDKIARYGLPPNREPDNGAAPPSRS
jgi:hypothetical protein